LGKKEFSGDINKNCCAFTGRTPLLTHKKRKKGSVNTFMLAERKPGELNLPLK
jgi:hypothetical protein